jgi:hypothetical protein
MTKLWSSAILGAVFACALIGLMLTMDRANMVDAEESEQAVPVPIEQLSPAEVAAATLKYPIELRKAHIHRDGKRAIMTMDLGHGCGLKVFYSNFEKSEVSNVEARSVRFERIGSTLFVMKDGWWAAWDAIFHRKDEPASYEITTSGDGFTDR